MPAPLADRSRLTIRYKSAERCICAVVFILSLMPCIMYIFACIHEHNTDLFNLIALTLIPVISGIISGYIFFWKLDIDCEKHHLIPFLSRTPIPVEDLVSAEKKSDSKTVFLVLKTSQKRFCINLNACTNTMELEIFLHTYAPEIFKKEK